MVKLVISGRVQGVGFRPFVYRTAKKLGTKGYVCNVGGQVEVVLEKVHLQAFLQELEHKPKEAQITSIAQEPTPPQNHPFHIAPSCGVSLSLKDNLPLDLAICADCLKDTQDPKSRFYRYPFTACAHCGPRFSLLESLPYDRPKTSMKNFKLCAACTKDYNDPTSRRFFAQSLSCPQCPIKLSFYNQEGIESQNALKEAINALKRGEVVALKGVGGFALTALATNKKAIEQIRQIKARPFKPLALMVSLQEALECVHLNQRELDALVSKEAPIVLARKKTHIYEHLAPNLDSLGVLLPYTALHHLILQEVKAIVFTSANLKGEPIITDLKELQAKLPKLCVLTHERPIVHGIDDSVVRLVAGKMRLVRLARGYAPLHLRLNAAKNTLGMGAQNKANLCFIKEGCLVTPELGGLDSVASVQRYKQDLDFFTKLYRKPEIIGLDLHPNYTASQIGKEQGAPFKEVQHHAAHLHALLAEWGLKHSFKEGQAVIAFICDGFGLAQDKSLWGGEVFLATYQAGKFQTKHLHSLQSTLYPRSTNLLKDANSLAYALAYQHNLAFAPLLLEPTKAHNIATLITKQIATISSTSVGRLFDAVAGFCKVGGFNTYEAQSAMQLESLAATHPTNDIYPFEIQKDISIAPMLRAMEQDILAQRYALVAKKFHNTLAHIALSLSVRYNLPLLLGGGVFLNRLLGDTLQEIFKTRVFFLPEALPPTDGALALGQAHFVANSFKG
ncbi:carbamoyltransferase HypF [Helicobacter ailurogastricus]|uniref:acylphosphatase n=1 Tax=Helicobacter ailurogastricus TaxID=1578720 RepID=A0A0K2XEE0_9HELI|nr:carbamoyltransferase HypF [Helicobacter ailurogastricus]CRF40716.1 [NiFe] hydrogenase metallocenter assembly protein HypF [Helicobacter ailurogastricus]CRF43109.1 [NiFe] hydrogenase metallocenter assembly protein HypF [Helicobacter ailurogastricus]CRF44338.1 [NiFe] hydrogenase metallocenter assembly protein HypF [Helicobacter ailurogastricus]